MEVEFKYQCEIKDQTHDLDGLYPSVKNAITTIARKEGYISHKIYKKMISGVGGNVFGVLFEINITGETKEGKRETNIFVKQIIPNSSNVELLSVSEIYSKEALFYKELAVIFTDLQNKANIPIKTRFKFVKHYDESNVDAIILENVSKLGFKTYQRMEVMNIKYAKLCIEQLSKFHALTFLIEKQMPKFFESKIKNLKQSVIVDANYKKYVSKIYESATKKVSSELKIKLDKWWETGLDNYSKYMNGTMTDIKCLCHGDFKMNNILYKENDGEITDVITVDYQLIHYGSPILDLIYFICMGTDKEFRRMYLQYLKDYYHDSLKTYLGYFDVLVDDVYPKKIFEKEFEECIDYVFVSCICILPFVLTTEESIDVSDKKIEEEGLELNDIYYDRLQGILDDFFNEDLYSAV